MWDRVCVFVAPMIRGLVVTCGSTFLGCLDGMLYHATFV